MQPAFSSYRPKVRSIYKRTAFQRSDSNAVRISLDAALQLFREEPLPSGAVCASDDELADPMRKLHCIETRP
jgi:SPX domain protein involved in polyphosphate accumulation